MPELLNKTIRLFLDSIGRRDEYEFYLNKFQSHDTASFAVICPEVTGFDEVVSVFNFDIEFLAQVDLFPLILLSGKDAPDMLELMTAGGHPYHALQVDDSELDVAPVADFIKQSRAEKRVVILAVPNIERHTVLTKLIPEITKRVHIIRTEGEIRSPGGAPLPYVYAVKTDPSSILEEDRGLAAEARDLLMSKPGTHISVASPWKLLQELFTVRGAGCVIRRGSHIWHIDCKADLDEQKLAALFEESFRKRLSNRALLDQISEGFVEENYRGAALLERHDEGMYLSKFAVGTQARGEGLANELWNEIMGKYNAVFWRARPDNPVNHWYEKQADGSHQTEKWRIFWKGVEPEHLPGVIAYAVSRNDDFEPS